LKYVYAIALLFACSVAAPAVAVAQGAAAAATAQLTAKVVAIDYDARIVTLQDGQGNVQEIKVGPSVKRFDALKVGDTITFTYQESIAYAIQKPGATGLPPQSSSVTPLPGSKPGGIVRKMTTALVTIQAIDPNAPSVTVKTQDGHTMALSVNDPSSLQGLNVGDQVQITYAQALMITVQ